MNIETQFWYSSHKLNWFFFLLIFLPNGDKYCFFFLNSILKIISWHFTVCFYILLDSQSQWLCSMKNDILSKLFPLLVFTYLYQSLNQCRSYIIEGEISVWYKTLCIFITSLNQILSISAPSSFPSPHFLFELTFFFNCSWYFLSYGQRFHVGDNFPYLVATKCYFEGKNE